MRSYGKVAPAFWAGSKTGRAIRKAGPEAVIVAVYLMSSPHSNMLGIYHQPLLYMAHETGLGIEGASKGLQSCIEAGFCRFDGDADVVWVVEMAAYQIAEALDPNDKRCRGIAKDYDALPDCAFLGAFFDRYSGAFHLPKRRVGTGEDAPPQPGGNQAPWMPHRSQEQEQEQEQERKATSDEVAGARPAADHPQLALVEQPKPAPDAGPWCPPDCPHQDVLRLWAEVLPALPQHDPAMWKGARADHLRARWRETAEAKRWASQADGLAYLRRLFAYVGQSRFLTGKAAPTRADRRPFVIELEWLVQPGNWARVHEGKYHQDAA